MVLAKKIKEKLIIPMLFNMFDFNIENPDGLMEGARWKKVDFKILKVSEFVAVKKSILIKKEIL